MSRTQIKWRPRTIKRMIQVVDEDGSERTIRVVKTFLDFCIRVPGDVFWYTAHMYRGELRIKDPRSPDGVNSLSLRWDQFVKENPWIGEDGLLEIRDRIWGTFESMKCELCGAVALVTPDYVEWSGGVDHCDHEQGN